MHYFISPKFFHCLIVVVATISLIYCNNSNSSQQKNDTSINLSALNIPAFNSDSAYHFIAKQVAFGPRVPNTTAHDSCAAWLMQKLSKYSYDIIIQEATIEAFNKTKLNIKNIIASFNPAAKKRILLCAHWDTRPFADQDIENQDKPIPGADDGGSGVGVLLEIARQLSIKPLGIGIDIILFDAEDYGKSNWRDSFCLGSQYWSKKKHKENYNAQYGILLDMVGAKGAIFTMEGYSIQFAPSVVRKVWNIAAEGGYSGFFFFEKTIPITDDHFYINSMAGIPCIDIIHHDFSTSNRFGKHWHTHNDNMSIIDKATLKAVGQTLLNVIYYEDNQLKNAS